MLGVQEVEELPVRSSESEYLRMLRAFVESPIAIAKVTVDPLRHCALQPERMDSVRASLYYHIRKHRLDVMITYRNDELYLIKKPRKGTRK